jgi:hypothetical protein
MKHKLARKVPARLVSEGGTRLYGFQIDSQTTPASVLEYFKLRFMDDKTYPGYANAYERLLSLVFTHAFTTICNAIENPNKCLRICMTGPQQLLGDQESASNWREEHNKLVQRAIDSANPPQGLQTLLKDLKTEAECSGRAAYKGRNSTGEVSHNIVLDLGGATADISLFCEGRSVRKPWISNTWTEFIGTVQIDHKFQEKVAQVFSNEENLPDLKLDFLFNSNWEDIKRNDPSIKSTTITLNVGSSKRSTLSFVLSL